MSVTESNTINFVDLKLIEEVRKPGREMLYQLKHPQYKNNNLRSSIWGEIAGNLKIEANWCMSRWKNLRARHRRLLSAKPKSGSATTPKSRDTAFLLRELEFLQQNIDEEEPESSYNPPPIPSNSEAETCEGSSIPGSSASANIVPENVSEVTPPEPRRKRTRRQSDRVTPAVGELIFTIRENIKKKDEWLEEQRRLIKEKAEREKEEKERKEKEHHDKKKALFYIF